MMSIPVLQARQLAFKVEMNSLRVWVHRLRADHPGKIFQSKTTRVQNREECSLSRLLACQTHHRKCARIRPSQQAFCFYWTKEL